MKREREEDEENGDAPDSVQKKARAAQDEVENGRHPDQSIRERSATPGRDGEATEPGDEEGDDRIYLPRSTSRAAVKKGIECPYLDTVSRQVRAGTTGVLFLEMGLACMDSSQPFTTARRT
jgi:hypothetical protein